MQCKGVQRSSGNRSPLAEAWPLFSCLDCAIRACMHDQRMLCAVKYFSGRLVLFMSSRHQSLHQSSQKMPWVTTIYSKNDTRRQMLSIGIHSIVVIFYDYCQHEKGCKSDSQLENLRIFEANHLKNTILSRRLWTFELLYAVNCLWRFHWLPNGCVLLPQDKRSSGRVDHKTDVGGSGTH